jgi:predicted CoA-binding protein
MQNAGFEIVPVPVYYPDVTEIPRREGLSRSADVPGEIDMVNRIPPRCRIFRKHVDEIIEAKPKSVLGSIRNSERCGG